MTLIYKHPRVLPLCSCIRSRDLWKSKNTERIRTEQNSREREDRDIRKKKGDKLGVGLGPEGPEFDPCLPFN